MGKIQAKEIYWHGTKMVMKMKLFLLFLISIGLCFPRNVLAANPREGKVQVKIVGFRNNTGEVRVGLFNSEKGFPDQPEHAFKVIKSIITDKIVSISFENIPYGSYAIGVLHDEDKDGEFDMWLQSCPERREIKIEKA